MGVAQLLRLLREDGSVDVEHIPYRFASEMEDQGRVRVGKLLAVLRVWGALVRARARGPIDVYVHPIGSPSKASTMKDALLLVVARRFARTVVVRFHGAGHADEWPQPLDAVRSVSRRILASADVAVVNDRTHERDAHRLGISEAVAFPRRLPDRLAMDLVERDDVNEVFRLFYVGHLGPQRGTSELIQVVSALGRQVGGVHLTLAGDPWAGYGREGLQRDLAMSESSAAIEYVGSVSGETKWRLFGRSHALVFPSRFEAESFGLVLAEALMWGLPIIATDWRAARSVLAGAPDVSFVDVTNLTASLATGIVETATGLRGDRGRSVFSDGNRSVFLQRYRETVPDPLTEHLVALARGRG